MIGILRFLFATCFLVSTSVFFDDKLLIIGPSVQVLHKNNDLILVAKDGSNLLEGDTFGFREDDGDEY